MPSPLSMSRRQMETQDPNRDEVLPDADLDELADRGEDAYTRTHLGWDEIDPRREIA